MTGGDEEFFAWLDGELTSEQCAAVEARVRGDLELLRLADQHRQMNARLHRAFDSVARAPLPDQLSAAASTTLPAEVVELAQARQKRDARVGARRQWFAIAASLVIGLATGTQLQPEPGPIRTEDGQLYAAASLDRALERQLATSQGDAAMRIGITFRDHAGTICRSFSGGRMAGLACRQSGRWQVRGLIGQPQPTIGDYRMAAGTDTQVASMIAATIAGAPLDASEERSARDNNWR